MTATAMLEVTRDLIALERGDDELLLANGFDLRPLYVQRGRNRVKRLLAAVRPQRTAEDLAATIPNAVPLIRLLRDYRILIEAGNDHVESAAQAQCPAAKDRITLYLLLSESCNQKCVYCLNGPQSYRTNHGAGMSVDLAIRSVEMCLKEACPGGSVEVAFFGGEPLLHWPLVKDVIRHCQDVLKPAHADKRIHYHLTSNLTLRPPDLIEWVKRHDISIVCDIDGPPQIHDYCRPYHGGGPTHARTAETVRQLVEAGVRLTLRATITSANHDCLPEVAEHHARLGAVSSLFVPVRPMNSDQVPFPVNLLPDPDKVIAAARQLRRSTAPGKANLFPFNDFSAQINPGVRHVVACGAPHGTTFVVGIDGDVYPCIYLVDQERYKLGNVAGTLDQRPLDDMLKAWHVDVRPDCRDCAWRYACGGGCPVMSLARDVTAAGNPAIAQYCRRMTCGLSQTILTDVLWELADKAHSARP